jgi:tricorn protease
MTKLRGAARRPVMIGFFVAIAIVASAPAQAGPGYLRYPEVSGDQVYFNAEGDLWTAPLEGGTARRLTSHAGSEYLPKVSPDGKWIAFAGDYDGNRDVFVMPVEGGEPGRLTWHPAADEPLGWTADGQAILFRSWRDHPNYNWELYRIPAAGGDPEKVPVGYIVSFSIDPATGAYAFTRSGGGGTWKRYRGGTADDVWVGDPSKADYKQITTFEGMDAFPMWREGRIYFLCDQGGTANIWSMKPDGSDRQQLTDLGTWDARWPSMDAKGRIVFMLAGGIHLFDPATGKERALSIDLPSERILTRTRYPNPQQYLTGFTLAPDGDRMSIEARGEIYSVPAKKEGVTLPITTGSGARERRVVFGPKGERVLFVTDKSGEEQIVTADAWGRGEVKEVTKPGASAFIYQPIWSPDGAWVAYGDQTHALFVVKADGGDPKRIDRCESAEIRDYSWSPDGRWLAYTKRNSIEFGAIFIYDTKDGSIHQATPYTTESGNPSWDPKGRYLYFLSDRSMNPWIDSRDFETIVAPPTRIYMVLLRPDVENPFAKSAGLPPKEGDGKDKDEDEAKDEKSGKDKEDDEEKKVEPVEIVFDGLADRFVELPVEAGRYYGLGATEKKLFFVSYPMQGLMEDNELGSDEPRPRATLMAFDFEKKEAKPFLQGISNYDLPMGGEKLAVMKARGEINVLDAGSPPGDDLSEAKVELGNIVIDLDPREEWRQIYYEAWRNQRDFFWDPGMHGVDWTAVRDQYATLLPRLATRADLSDLIMEMIGELSNSHTYVWGGDYTGHGGPHVSTGLLGAALSRQGEVFRVDRIYRADAADRARSPLQEPEASVQEGEYILAVNHRPFEAGVPFESSLQNLAGKPVVITVNSKPDKGGARDVVVTPMNLGQEAGLRYADWVRRNREYVAEKTGGRIGYIHLPDMGGRGMSEFDKWFYPQLDKEGMVVDARWNGGGFVSQLIVERLLRKLIWWDRTRNGGVYTYPSRVLNGPFVVLTNQFAGSDGDIFPAAIQTAGIAPVIGKRSWGGVVGIRADKLLVDGGMLTEPEYAWYSPKLGWGIENHGVDPDIDIDNTPQDVAKGVDAQLDRAIQEVMRLHEQKPPLEPNFAPAPNHSRDSFRQEK